MKKGLKIFGILCLIFFIAIFSITFFAKKYFTSDKIKELILPYAEQSIGRKISIDSIDIHLFKGIEVNTIAIQDARAFSSGSFLTANKFILKYSLWPLLKKQLMIHKLIIVEPSISLIRNEAGNYNFDDLLANNSSKSKAKREPESPAPASKALLFTVSQIALQKGTITFLDKSILPSRSLSLEEINFKAKDISLNAPFQFSLSAGIPAKQQNGTISVTGHINLVSKDTDLELKIQNMDLTLFEPFYKDAIPLQLLSARLVFSTNVKSYQGKKILSKGKITIDQVSLLSEALSIKKPIKNLDLIMDYTIQMDLTKKEISIDQINLTTLQVPLLISGKITNFDSAKRTLEFSANSKKIDLHKILKAIPSALLPEIVKQMDINGKLADLKIHLKSSPDHPLFAYQGKVNLQDITATYKPYASFVPTLNGSIEITPQEIKILPTKISLLQSQILLEGLISDYLKKPFLTLQIDSTFPYLANIYKAIPKQISPMIEKIEIKGATKLSANLATNLKDLSKMKYAGTVELQDLNVKYQPYSSLSPNIKGLILFDEQKITIEKLQTRISQSDLSLKGTVIDYLKNPSFQLDLQSTFLNVDEILASFPQKPQSSEDTPKTKDKEIEPIDLKGLSASGTIKITKSLYKNLALTDTSVQYALKNNLFEWKNFKTHIEPKGIIATNGSFDFSSLKYISSVQTDSVPVNKFLSLFYPKIGAVFTGKLSSSFQVSGTGLKKEEIQKNLHLNSSFNLFDGKIQNTKIGEGISSLLKIARLSDLHFDSMKGKMEVIKGKVKLASRIVDKDYLIEPRGIIGLDGSLSLDLPTKISPKISGRNKMFSQYLADDKGWINIPLKAKGTVLKPKVSIDTKAVRKKTEKKLKKKLKEKILQELFKEKEKTKESPEKNLIKDTLKNLFK